jgi:mono/diheme cytochrome c family protein
MMQQNRQPGRRVPAAACAIAVLGLGIAVAATSDVQGSDRSVNDAVYSKTQAERGVKLFDSNCSTCHDPGRFTGAEFISHWSEKPLHALFDVMSTTMPEDNPGALEPQQYGDILAYFLELNGYPAGAEDLPGAAEALKTVRMEPKK